MARKLVPRLPFSQVHHVAPLVAVAPLIIVHDSLACPALLKTCIVQKVRLATKRACISESIGNHSVLQGIRSTGSACKQLNFDQAKICVKPMCLLTDGVSIILVYVQ